MLEDTILSTDSALVVPLKSQNIPFPDRYVTVITLLAQALRYQTTCLLLCKAVYVPLIVTRMNSELI